MSKFKFKPADFVPFKDAKVLDRVREIGVDEIEKHEKKDFKIKVVENDELEFIWVWDMFKRIFEAYQKNEKIVMIIPNPAPSYKKLAFLINKFGINCKNVYTFNMDEWADEEGNVADIDYPQSFIRSTFTYLYDQIDKEFRMPKENIIYPTTSNISSYTKMIEEAGGADVCYSGPGWAGHLAFIDPDVKEFKARNMEEWKKMGSRIVTLHPLTIAQNSLHGCFGASGDIANVPPKAATIGPKDVINAKDRVELHGISTLGTQVAWQRMISKLVLHGPVTDKVPSSILQTLKTQVYITRNIAKKVEPIWDMQY